MSLPTVGCRVEDNPLGVSTTLNGYLAEPARLRFATPTLLGLSVRWGRLRTMLNSSMRPCSHCKKRTRHRPILVAGRDRWGGTAQSVRIPRLRDAAEKLRTWGW